VEWPGLNADCPSDKSLMAPAEASPQVPDNHYSACLLRHSRDGSAGRVDRRLRGQAMNAACLVGIGLFMALLGQFLGDDLLDGMFLVVLIYLPVAWIIAGCRELWRLWQRIAPDLFKPVRPTEPRPSSSMLLPLSSLTPKLPQPLRHTPISALPRPTVPITASHADCSH
jgi:hypothetical protein